tara:strand:- start:766 stop:1020 length:255 start_codon:yes stop_codon:yes gene_type:complete
MGFTSETAAIGGKLSKRGKGVSTTLKNEVTLLAEDLIKKIDVDGLTDRERIVYLKAILPFVLKRNETETNEGTFPDHIQIEIIK